MAWKKGRLFLYIDAIAGDGETRYDVSVGYSRKRSVIFRGIGSEEKMGELVKSIVNGSGNYKIKVNAVRICVEKDAKARKRVRKSIEDILSRQ
jgi:hypothetical protein